MPSAVPFEQQPLEAPLNDEAKRKLRELAAKRVDEYSLYPRVTKAIEFLDKGVGPIIDRAVEEKERHEKKQARLAERGEEVDPDEEERYEAFQRKVQQLTELMDKSIRQVVDTKIWLEELPNSLNQVTAAASDPSQPRHDLDAGDEDDNYGTQTQLPDKSPSTILEAAFTSQQNNWNDKSLTDKYARDNDYIGWYTNRWNSLNPGESAPPMPSAAIWFAAEEGRRAPDQDGNENGQNEGEDDDSEIEIEREKINIKCPITLMPFEDPVVSSKCNHSFEKTAILSMIQRSTDRQELPPEQEAEIASIRRPRDRAQRREQLRSRQPVGIKCPECRTFFLEEDLRPNPVLKRRVQQVLAWQRRQNERARSRDDADDENIDSDDDDDDDGDHDDRDEQLRGTHARPVGLDSSPMPSRQRRNLVKAEQSRRSDTADEPVPETQQTSQELIPRTSSQALTRMTTTTTTATPDVMDLD